MARSRTVAVVLWSAGPLLATILPGGGLSATVASAAVGHATVANIVHDGTFATPDAATGQPGAAQGQGLFSDYCAADGIDPDCPAAHPHLGSSWTVTRGSVDINIDTYVEPPSGATAGSQGIDLDGYAPGTLEQTLKTKKHITYHGSFLLGTNPDGTSGASANPVKHMKLLIGKRTVGRYAIRVTRSRLVKFSFRAPGSSTALSFASTDNEASENGALITDVVVSP